MHFYVEPTLPEAPRPQGEDSTHPPETVRSKQPMWFETPQRPSEVLLDDGTSLNQFLLANGYAAFDFTDRYLDKDDRARYAAAEAQARAAGLGIWSSPESVQEYLSAKESFQHQERLKRAGLIFYLLTQALLIVVTVILMYLARRSYGHESFVSVSKLLAIPGVLLLVVFLRLIWTAPFQPDDPNLVMLYAFYLLFVCAAFLWGAKQFFTLVVLGPLREWQSLWTSSQAKRAVWVFFFGLGLGILVFGILYRLFGGIDSTASLRLSFSQTLTLGYPVPRTPVLDRVFVLHSLFLWLWLPLCGIFLPSLKDKPASLSLSKALFVSLASALLLALIMASVFANLFYYNIQFSGFNRTLDLEECFLLAMLTFVRRSYSDVYPTSVWMISLQSLEVGLSLFLQLVGLRFILASLKRVWDARNERSATIGNG